MSTTPVLQIDVSSPTLGELVYDHRTSNGESMRAVSRRCDRATADIAQVELGRADLETEVLAAVVHAYAVPRVQFPVNRSQLVVDLASGAVVVRPRRQLVGESPTDAMLFVYLELLYANRDLPATTEVAITSLDLDVVRLMLSTHREAVEARIDDLVVPARVATAAGPSRVATHATGAVAAALALVGMIALAGARKPIPLADVIDTAASVAVLQAIEMNQKIDPRDPAASEPVVVTPPIEVKIIDPLIVTRRPDGLVITSDQPLPIEPSKDTE